MDAWGYHLALDISKCDMDIITNPDKIKEFSRKLVKEIEMIPYGEPQVVHFCNHVKEKAGWTLIQLIETSNIMCHFCDKDGDAYLDVFSCQEFSPKQVIDFIRVELQPEYIIMRGTFYRDANTINI